MSLFTFRRNNKLLLQIAELGQQDSSLEIWKRLQLTSKRLLQFWEAESERWRTEHKELIQQIKYIQEAVINEPQYL